MAPYPLYLRQLINKRHITIYTLAAESGVDRTLIQKMLKGQRIPSDPAVVRSLAAALLLTPEESDSLFESYLSAKMGEGVYKRRKMLLDFYNEFDSFQVNSRVSLQNMASGCPPGENEVIYGKLDVELLTASILEREAAKPSGRIRVIAQPECAFLFDLLSVIGAQKSELVIDHILCFENSHQEMNFIYNFGCLRAIMPIFTSVRQYRPRCYYGSIGDRFGATSVMPFLVLTEDYVMRIAYDASYASVSSLSQQRELYSRIFQESLEKASSLAVAFHSPLEEISFLNQMSSEYDHMIHNLTADPCLLPFVDEQMLSRYLEPSLWNDEKSIGPIRKYLEFQDMRNDSAGMGNFYFSEEGLNRFLTTGRFSEVPEEYYSPIETADCFRLLKAMYKVSAEGKYHAYLVNTQKLRIPFSLSTYLLRRGAVCFVHTAPNHPFTALLVSEPSIVASVQDFLSHLPESNFVSSPETTLQYLKKRLDCATAERIPEFSEPDVGFLSPVKPVGR